MKCQRQQIEAISWRLTACATIKTVANNYVHILYIYMLYNQKNVYACQQMRLAEVKLLKLITLEIRGNRQN